MTAATALAMDCHGCGLPMDIDPAGVSFHLDGGHFGDDPFDADADHVAYHLDLTA